MRGETAVLSRGFLKVARVKEDWKVEPGSVHVSFFRGDQRIQFSVPDNGDWIDPGVVLAVNELLPPEGPRFYFVENGGANHAVITRATEYERFLLEATRPISPGERTPTLVALGQGHLASLARESDNEPPRRLGPTPVPMSRPFAEHPAGGAER